MTQEQIKKIEQLKKLLDVGVLTQEEFDKCRLTILDKSEAEQKPPFKKRRFTYKNTLYILACIVLLVVIGLFIHNRIMSNEEANENENENYDKKAREQKEALEGTPEKIHGFYIGQGWANDADNLNKLFQGHDWATCDSCEIYFDNEVYEGVPFDELSISMGMGGVVTEIRLQMYNIENANTLDSLYNKFVNKLTSTYRNVHKIDDNIFVAESNYNVYLTRTSLKANESYSLDLTFRHENYIELLKLEEQRILGLNNQ